MEEDGVPTTFRRLVESAERKFGKVRDAPAYGRTPNHYFPKVFKAYMKVWDYQQKNRSKLVESGLQRWEIGEIASRIGQLYFVQYMRTSEARFLLESYIFYEAILNRGYFEGSTFKALKDRGLRFKEFRFYARFLLVSLILNRWEMVKLLLDRFKALLDDSKAKFPDTTFKEWKVVMQEMVRFMKVDAAFTNNTRPLRYCAMFDSYPSSLPYVARYHAKKVLKLRDALLMSYHRNEVKFAELTIDTFRMLQCLEWEPSGSFYQTQPVESHDNGTSNDQSATSGLIDINLVADMTDPSLPPNPKKAVLYRPSATQLLAVLAAICDELPPDSVMLIYIAASGDSGQTSVPHKHVSGSVRTSMKLNTVYERSHYMPENLVNGKGGSSLSVESSVWLGPTRSGGSNNLYPGDLIPFTRRPAFFIIDSDNSHSFKVLHGAERGEPAALLLSPSRPTFKSHSSADITQNGSQFTLFLTAPLQACWQMFGLTFSEDEVDVMEDAECIVSAAFAEWEVILCTSTGIDLVWAQVLSEPLLRRIILRFILCRSVLTFFRRREDNDHYLPMCLPELPDSVSAASEVVQSAVVRLADHLKVSHCFRFDNL